MQKDGDETWSKQIQDTVLMDSYSLFSFGPSKGIKNMTKIEKFRLETLNLLAPEPKLRLFGGIVVGYNRFRASCVQSHESILV